MCERTFVTWAHRSLLFTLATALASCALPPPPDIEPEAGPDAEPDASIDAGIDAMPDAVPDSGLLPAQLQLNVDGHDFSDVTVGEATEPQEFFVQNVGETISGDISVAFTGAQAADFSFVSAGADDCDVGPLEPLQTCRVLVRFSPDAAGPRAATLTASSPMGGSDTISLTGNGLTAGDLELVTGASLTFDTTEIQATSATETITVRNTGESATAALTVILADEDNFEITSDGCGGQPLPSLGTCDVVVRFTPSEVGAWTTQLSVRESPTVGVSTNLQATATARLTVTRTGSGAIVSDPAGLSCGAGCTSQTFSFDEPAVQLTATADSGHVFDGWTGACAAANPSNVCSVSLTTPLTTAGAAFRQVYPLVVTVSGEGTVTSAPAGISCGAGALDCDQTYDAGTPVTLSVTPADGWEVYAWSGTGTSCGAGVRMCSTTMNQARNVTVELRRQYLVMVMTGGSGAASGTVTGGGITCPGACSTYAFENSMITLTQSPGAQGGASQARFSGWGGACTGTATTCNLTITGATTVSATFVQQHRLALTLTGAGTGSVSAGANTCSGGTCNWYYDTGSTPSLSTSPGAGSLFVGFSGDCTGTSCSPSMTAPRAVTATFGVARALTVTVTGSGTVTSVPAGINCGTDCTESYLDGTDVTLTVTPSAGWEVYAWSGSGSTCTAPTHTCTTDMTTARNVTVELRRQWTITVNTSGSGTGAVTAPGLSCTTPMTGCTKTVFEGENVTLTQNQGAQGGASQSRFGGWSGACSGTGTTCTLTNITANQTVGASSILQYRLAVSITGTGSVTGNGNTCGSGTCNWYYDTGAAATLTATPSGGALFLGYGGDCAGSSCNLTMSSSRAVSATFGVGRHLNVAVTGSGTVTSAPSGINCGTDCDEDYLDGTDVTLTATPADGWEVFSWGGTGSACTSGMRMCITDMTTARNVTVEFRRQWTVTVNTSGSGSGTVTGGSSTCTTPQVGCLTYVFDGGNLTLTQNQGDQTGASRNRFGGWSNACTGTGATCALSNITSNLTVGASSILQHRLAVSITGSGSVTGNGNTCGGGTCNWYYDTGAAATLSATPGAGALFTGYGGDCAGSACALTMSTARAVSASFGVARHLNVAVTGSGTVSSSPGGISCGTDCDEDYLDGTDVTLTVTPSAGWEVYDWGGAADACIAPSHTCVIDMTTTRNVTVELRRQWTVTVNTSGSGSGTVTAPGLSCPTPMTGCTVTVFEGSSLTLTQSQGTPGGASQSRFGGWSGACSGTGTTCALTSISANQTVGASSILQYRLALTMGGDGGGTVTQGANTCTSGTCNWYYDTGTMLSLTATPNASTWFDGYTGACTGAACSLTMSAARTVGTQFRLMQCTPSSEVCNDTTEHYVECGPTGLIEREFDCPLECSSTAEKCMDVDPYDNNNATYDLYPYLEMSPGGPEYNFVGVSTINTTDGRVCVDANENGVIESGTGYDECLPNPTSALVSGLRIFWFSSMTVTGTLKVSGSYPLVILVDDEIAITGTIDLAAVGSTSGPGAQSLTATCRGGSTTGNAGGGGSGRGSAGGAGGAIGGSGGPTDLVNVVPLRGGCVGGYAGAANETGHSKGGGGGGAIHLVSRVAISISGSGTINASGGGGRSGTFFQDHGGGGGGSGGAVLLEAPTVNLLDNAVVSTKGGGGAAVGRGSGHGEDGGTDAAVADGGVNGALPVGGAGATRVFGTSTGSVSAQAGAGSGGLGAGGGGGVGVARVATRTGSYGLAASAAIRAYGSPTTVGAKEMQ